MPKEKVAKEAEKIAAETLTGDVRDALLSQIRGLQKPYARCSQDEQQEIIDHCSKIATNLVEQAVSLIAAHGHNVIYSTIESLTVKDGIKAVVKCANVQSSLLELGDAVGKTVLLVVAEKETFTGEKAPVKGEPDQKTIPLHLAKDEE